MKPAQKDAGSTYAYEPPLYRDIGKLFGISAERVRQIERRALKKMRRHPILLALAKDYGIEEKETP